MSVKFISPKKSVNSAFLKLPVPVEKMEDFKLSLKNLYSRLGKSFSVNSCTKSRYFHFLLG